MVAARPSTPSPVRTHRSARWEGRGRPLELGRPLAHAYVIRVVAEFQAFTRDLHDLGAEILVAGSTQDQRYRPRLTVAVTEGRSVDRGNADLRSLQGDFRRLGLSDLNQGLGDRNSRWSRQDKPKRRGDKASYDDLLRLRNALAHGNQKQLDVLRSQGVADTVTWARARLPGLDRTAKAMDRLVWDHLVDTFGADPW